MAGHRHHLAEHPLARPHHHLRRRELPLRRDGHQRGEQGRPQGQRDGVLLDRHPAGPRSAAASRPRNPNQVGHRDGSRSATPGPRRSPSSSGEQHGRTGTVSCGCPEGRVQAVHHHRTSGRNVQTLQVRAYNGRNWSAWSQSSNQYQAYGPTPTPSNGKSSVAVATTVSLAAGRCRPTVVPSPRSRSTAPSTTVAGKRSIESYTGQLRRQRPLGPRAYAYSAAGWSSGALKTEP